MDARTETQGRLWEETEYCIDEGSGLLQVLSIAPGSYVVYGYGGNLQFHGRRIPDRVTVYAGCAQKLDAQIGIGDAGAVAGSLAPTQEMVASGPAVRMALPERTRIDISSPAVAGAIQPVIVLAELDPQGRVLEAEALSAADPALVQPGLNAVKSGRFPATGVQRQVYVNVRFFPEGQLNR